MSTQTRDTTIHSFNALDYVGTDPLARDQGQSGRLHQPDMMITSIDPISGRDIDGLAGRPYIVDGNITIYFESEENRQAYIDTPMDHPLRLPDNPDEDWVAEG